MGPPVHRGETASQNRSHRDLPKRLQVKRQRADSMDQEPTVRNGCGYGSYVRRGTRSWGELKAGPATSSGTRPFAGSADTLTGTESGRLLEKIRSSGVATLARTASAWPNATTASVSTSPSLFAGATDLFSVDLNNDGDVDTDAVVAYDHADAVRASVATPEERIFSSSRPLSVPVRVSAEPAKGLVPLDVAGPALSSPQLLVP